MHSMFSIQLVRAISETTSWTLVENKRGRSSSPNGVSMRFVYLYPVLENVYYHSFNLHNEVSEKGRAIVFSLIKTHNLHIK